MDIRKRFLVLAILCWPLSNAYGVVEQRLKVLENLFQPASSTRTSPRNNATYTFSAATPGNINYARLCMATDATCGTCAAPYAVYKVGGSAVVPYDTVGTPHQLQASAIQSYLTGNGYGDGTYYIGLYVQSAGLDCNSGGSYCSTSQDNNGHVLCVQAVSSGGSTTLTPQDNGVAVLSTNTTPYLFINNGNTSSTNANTTSVCPAAAAPFACTSTNNSGVSPTSPYGIAIDPPSQNVYVISRGAAGNSLSCSISSSNGGLTCSVLSFAADLAAKSCTAQGIAVDPPGQNAYVTCGNNVYKCALGGSTCDLLTLSGTAATLSNPMGIAIDPTNSYMYIANLGSTGYLTACTIAGLSCTSGNSGNVIAYVAVDNTGTYVYTGKSNGSSIYSCPVTGTTIGTCSNKSSGTTKVFGIAPNPSGANVYIAIQGSTGLINSCPAGPGAAISGACTATSSTGLFTGMQGAAWGNVVGP